MEVGTCEFLQGVDHHCMAWVAWTFVVRIDVVAKVPHHLPNQKHVSILYSSKENRAFKKTKK
jgi:hypothetical protein